MASLIYCRSKNDGLSGGAHERGSLKFSSGWTVRVDSNNITAAAVLALGLAAGDLPAIGSLSIDDPQAACVDLHGTRDKDDPCLWHVTADWERSPARKRDPSDDQKQPDQRRPRWSGRFVAIPASRFVDYGGIDWTSGNTYQAPQLLADAAWTPFDPPPDMPIYCDEITIRQYESTSGRAAKRAFLGMSNSDTWQGAGPGTAFVDQIETQDEFVQGTWWWLQTYVILIKPRIQIELPSGGYTYIGGFDPEFILNAGPRKVEWDGAVGSSTWRPVPITHQDENGNPWYDGRPCLLDANGLPIGSASNGQLAQDPIFIHFHTKQCVAFASMNLTPPSGWTG